MPKPQEKDPIQESEYLHQEPMPIVRVKGSHRQMGQQIGEAMRPTGPEQCGERPPADQ